MFRGPTSQRPVRRGCPRCTDAPPPVRCAIDPPLAFARRRKTKATFRPVRREDNPPPMSPSSERLAVHAFKDGGRDSGDGGAVLLHGDRNEVIVESQQSEEEMSGTNATIVQFEGDA